MRITKAQVDELYSLKQAAEQATAAYEAAIAKIREAGPNVYKGNCAALVIEEQTRRTVDNKAIFAICEVAPELIAKHTKETTYTRAIFKEAK
jgi:Xaa-Pro aminopeptidase